MVSWTIILLLVAASGLMLVLELRGLNTSLTLSFRGDVQRETRWWAQYGQGACTAVVVLLMWQLDSVNPNAWLVMLVAVVGSSIVSMLIKRALGRVRPNRENAGQFLGPTWKHANYRESFPSSHSACAIAMTVVLAALYPPGAITFWVLGIGCAVLRYIMDAHWPSDVFAGVALGATVANLTLMGFALPAGH